MTSGTYSDGNRLHCERRGLGIVEQKRVTPLGLSIKIIRTTALMPRTRTLAKPQGPSPFNGQGNLLHFTAQPHSHASSRERYTNSVTSPTNNSCKRPAPRTPSNETLNSEFGEAEPQAKRTRLWRSHVQKKPSFWGLYSFSTYRSHHNSSRIRILAG